MLVTPGRQRLAADLRWLFTAADGEMGLRSNFSGMVASLEGGGHSAPSSFDPDDRKLQAALRSRRIRRSLDMVPDWARVVLGVVYRHPTGGESALICALSSTVAEHRRSGTKRGVADWLERTSTSKSAGRRLLYVKLRMEATELVEKALDLYAGARSELAAGRARQETSA